MEQVKNPNERQNLANLYRSMSRHTRPIKRKESDPITLDEAYLRLGKATIQEEMLLKFVKRLNVHASPYVSVMLWPLELDELRTCYAKQSNLCRELIRSIIYHEKKELDEKKKTETTQP